MAANTNVQKPSIQPHTVIGSDGYIPKARPGEEDYSEPDSVILHESLQEKVIFLTKQLAEEQRKNSNLLQLNQFMGKPGSTTDPLLAAQQMAATLQKITRCSLVCVFSYLAGEQRFLLLADAGPCADQVPHPLTLNSRYGFPGYLFRAARLLTSQELHSDQPLYLGSTAFPSLLAAPLLYQSEWQGLILLADVKVGVFQKPDRELIETACLQIVNMWMFARQAETVRKVVLSLHPGQDKQRKARPNTEKLYALNLSILKAENLSAAALEIAQTICRQIPASASRLILYTADGLKEADVCYSSRETGTDPVHLPEENILHETFTSRKTRFLSAERDEVVFPIQTVLRCYGALWIKTTPNLQEEQIEETQLLLNQASTVLERMVLLTETRQQANELVRSYHRLERSCDHLLVALIKALDARDPETESHSIRVTTLTVALGKAVGLSQTELQALERGALLHDIGKIGISDTVLMKPGPLDWAEWQLMRKHPQIGANIVQEIPALQDALSIIAHHQERWDGSGYPMGLSGTGIPLLARIFAVVDVYDAMTSNRPYRKPLKPAEAIDYLESQSGKLFDPQVVEKMVQILRSKAEPL